MDTFYGVPRCYGLLAFLGFALALEKRRFLLLPVFISLAFIFYPAVAVMLAASSVFAPLFFREHFREKGELPRYLWTLFAGALFCLFVLSRSVALENAVQAFNSGTFQGAKFFLRVSAPLDTKNLADLVLNFLLNLNEFARLYSIFTFLLAAICVYGFLWGRKLPSMLPKAVQVMLLGAGASFLVLYFIHPVSAARQTTFIVPLALVFLAAEVIEGLAWKGSKPAALAAACSVLFLALHPIYNETFSCRTFRPVYDYLERVQGDVVVAAYPGGMLSETIPVFAKKTAFYSDDFTDQYLLLLKNSDEISGRRKALLTALYSSTEAGALELAQRYGVAYLVFEKSFYEPAFLEKIKSSGFSTDQELAGILAGGTEPAAFYRYARQKAVLNWKDNESEGFILDLRALSGAKDSKAAGSGVK
jgi:hypothetical protein